MYRRVSILLRKHFVSVLILCASIVIPFSSVKAAADPAKGKAIFQQNCASCHSVTKKLTGPALAGVEDRWPDKKLLHQWVHNSASVLASGDKYANDLFIQFNKTAMTAFPALKDEEIDDILAYIKVAAVPTASTPTPGGETGTAEDKGNDNSLLFGIITLVLAVVALILMQINSNLNKLAGDKEGVATADPVPFYKNKAYIAIGILLLFMVGGYFTINGAVGLGRQKDYMPAQPIFYSHKVHAGINQINCLYCHAGAEKSKHAMIPSENICMNCHKAIKEYSGPELVTAEGKKVNGTEEIAKLYDYVGWDPEAGKYTKPGRPIEWTKIHNLPDHVYFNHSQHVVAGKQQCQTCHGAITEMDEVHQFADLSMGWCINCHRTTKVQFADNNYYSIFEKLHQDIKDKKIDSVTVEMVGGTECQKCHY
ncbi:quinol:cytochrome c oxidoreductase pentaheme cytochrome subunit [Chitinophaga niastensis]|uniref:Quinol:cytochrome c oxidoreductase pentaheme cytochrome subunit n=1 Tax=Chitinophaga niastensis TaxID=536980 RepID=A0A2P8HTJ7_CHINA|nr:c-type cytochrome [Chitinophaga niastensis]PSL49547.1 quinol:cytochrome c oxidoreductase pentaheme cytochrome subunit [Chitinophaga niastensis]